jgi:hypothetical protein
VSVLRSAAFGLVGLALSCSQVCSQGAEEPRKATPEVDSSMPMVLPGYAQLEGFTLKEPNSDLPLMHRHIEVITVVGDVDPPFVDGDDRVQTVNPEYNEPRFKALMNQFPGMVKATMTVFVEEPSASDTRIQLWEQVIVRVFDAEEKESAKHYCDTTPWKAQPGFNDITPKQVQFGAWKAIKKSHSNSK